MEKTTHYQLNQWAPDDRIMRTDFNGDNAAIDEALKLTRTFAGDNAVSFVNGVLDALAKSQEQAS